jgi:hypothetical protein
MSNRALQRELTIWRRIYQHQREMAEAALNFANTKIAELDEQFLRYCASGIETEGHDAEERHGAEHESPTAESGDAQQDTAHD